MSTPPDCRKPAQQKGGSGIPWIASALVLVSGVGVLAYLRTCQASESLGTKAEHAAQHIENAVKILPSVAAKFKTGTITHTFRESIPQVVSSRGEVLELATSRSDEAFKKTDSLTTGWGTIPLGKTVSLIGVPVTFRYHLRLSDPWRLAAKDHVCQVLAPPIRPSLPPAIHTDKMEKYTSNGWARWNKDENLAELEKSLTPVLVERAMNPEHQKLVREACRQSTVEFIKKWLMREEFWRTGRFSSVIVFFPDEVSVRSDDELEAYAYTPLVKP